MSHAQPLMELDVMKPGKLFARAENEMDTTYHIVLPQAHYTKDALSKNPQINAKDQLMQPFTVPFQQADKQGMTTCDLKATGRADQIRKNVRDRIERNEPKIETVRAVVIVTSRKGNQIPDKQLADICDLRLVPVPGILLKGITAYLTVQNFKAGKRDFEVELRVMGDITSVQLSTQPHSPIMAQGKTLQGQLAVHVKEGEVVKIKIPAQFSMKAESKQTQVERSYVHYVPGGWRTAGGRKEYDTRTDSREIWTGTNVVLRAAGVGHFAHIVETINLTAQSWASDWLAGPPPPPFYHNVC